MSIYLIYDFGIDNEPKFLFFSSKFLRLGTCQNVQEHSRSFNIMLCECSMFGMSAPGTNSSPVEFFNFHVHFSKMSCAYFASHLSRNNHCVIISVWENSTSGLRREKRMTHDKTDITRLRSFTWRNIQIDRLTINVTVLAEFCHSGLELDRELIICD